MVLIRQDLAAGIERREALQPVRVPAWTEQGGQRRGGNNADSGDSAAYPLQDCTGDIVQTWSATLR